VEFDDLLDITAACFDPGGAAEHIEASPRKTSKTAEWTTSILTMDLPTTM
jgi:hypothetical protein